MKYNVTVPEAVVEISLVYLPIKSANSLCNNACDEVLLIFQMMQYRKSLMRHWLSYSRWYKELVAFCFACKDSKSFLYDRPLPVAHHSMQD